MDKTTEELLIQEVAKTTLSRTLDCSVAVFHVPSEELASGILVSIADRLFLATAGHVLQGRNVSELQLVGTPHAALGRPGPKILQSEYRMFKSVDVGYMELEPATAAILAKKPLPIDQVVDLRSGDPSCLTALVGHPSDHMKDDPTRKAIVPRLLAVFATPITPSKYASDLNPLPANTPPADPDIDVFLDYEAKNSRRADDYTPYPFPRIPGMSGGGHFEVSPNPGGIWSPNNLRLYAIQSTWSARQGGAYARGTQMVYWIKLILETIPQLAPMLSAKYPRSVRVF